MSDESKYPQEEEWVSRSEKKRNIKNVQVIARSLLKLSDNQRKNLPMSEELNEAIVLANKLKNTKEAFRRQMQLVTKELRQSNIEEIKVGIENLALGHNGTDLVSRQLELVRDGMLNNGDEAVNNFLELHPTAERQKLRQLIRQANKEAKLEKPVNKSTKELFKYIKSFN